MMARRFFRFGNIFSQSYKTLKLQCFSHKKLCRISSVSYRYQSSRVTTSSETHLSKFDSVENVEEPKVIESNKQLLDVSDYAPALIPSFNLAAYANKSHTLQEFIKLGVEIYKFDLKKDILEYILSLDFEKDVKNHLFFLVDVGVPAEMLGTFITRNPLIFKEDIYNLQIRINYLLSKKFTASNIARLLTKNPHWLSYSTEEIDKRLGYFQKVYNLTGDEVRFLACRRPALITSSLDNVKVNTFSIKEEMGYNDREIKTILLEKPGLFMIDRKRLIEQFDFVHNVMKLSHEMILKNVMLLQNRRFRTEQRHNFLVSLGRAQYDPKLPQYVCPSSLMLGDDVEFCKNVAKTSIDTYNLFLKTL